MESTSTESRHMSDPKVPYVELGTEEPQVWPVSKKIRASVAGAGYSLALLFTATAYTAGTKSVAAEFNLSQVQSILPFSLFFWGIMFAPLYSPHVSERVGRIPFYACATLGMGAFTIGAAYSRSFASLCVCRFFAGLFGGSNVVQVEGTFADVWPAMYTPSYYAFLAASQYFGAATGAVVNWHVITVEDWRWTQYTSLMVTLAALLLGVNAPETYRRHLVRVKARSLGTASPLEPALSGVTFAEMAQLTLINPVRMVFTQPVVLAITLYLGLNFGILFQWFISVPAVLSEVAMFQSGMIGSAFTTAIGGTAAAIILIFGLDQALVRSLRSKLHHGQVDIEFRIVPVLFGAVLTLVSLFMIAFTINPNFSPYIPIAGNGLFVLGSFMTLTGFVSYLFDAYGPQGTLSALTVAAVFRVALAGAIPLTVPAASSTIGPKWYVLTWAILSCAFAVLPLYVLLFGRNARTNSKFYNKTAEMPMSAEGRRHTSQLPA